MEKKLLTLGLVVKDGQILLGMKKRGFGEGKWNGFGGKLEAGETLEQGLIREFEEETSLKISNPIKRGVFDFQYANEQKILQVHLYEIREFEGQPVETEEMFPKWFSFGEIPLEQMWPDDSYWMPLFLNGKNFEGEFLFNENNEIIGHKLSETNSLIL